MASSTAFVHDFGTPIDVKFERMFNQSRLYSARHTIMRYKKAFLVPNNH